MPTIPNPPVSIAAPLVGATAGPLNSDGEGAGEKAELRGVTTTRRSF